MEVENFNNSNVCFLWIEKKESEIKQDLTDKNRERKIKCISTKIIITFTLMFSHH